MEETREQRIARLTEEFRKSLEEKFPEKGSTMQRIEELTTFLCGLEKDTETQPTPYPSKEGRGARKRAK